MVERARLGLLRAGHEGSARADPDVLHDDIGGGGGGDDDAGGRVQKGTLARLEAQWQTADSHKNSVAAKTS